MLAVRLFFVLSCSIVLFPRAVSQLCFYTLTQVKPRLPTHLLELAQATGNHEASTGLGNGEQNLCWVTDVCHGVLVLLSAF